ARLIPPRQIAARGDSTLAAQEMQEVWAAPGGAGSQTDQLLYNLDKRWAEATLLPMLRSRKTPLMAYTPLGQGALARAPGLRRIATEAGLDPIQLALAWTLRLPDVFAVPKSTRPERIDGFLAAAGLTLPDDVLAALDEAFPPPAPDAELEML
ncbi:MAG: aldo/keto reductase, partial [Alphaproteobacteria bacterium]